MKREKPSCVQLKHNDWKPFRCKSRKSNYIIIEPNKKKKKLILRQMREESYYRTTHTNIIINRLKIFHKNARFVLSYRGEVTSTYYNRYLFFFRM